jgi:hypothetical protein
MRISDGPNSRPQLFTKPFVSRLIGESRMPCHEIRKGLDLTRRFHDTYTSHDRSDLCQSARHGENQPMVSVLERSSARKDPRRRMTAESIAAMSIGGMIGARTLVDRTLADRLREGCMAVALELGGWKERAKRM